MTRRAWLAATVAAIAVVSVPLPSAAAPETDARRSDPVTMSVQDVYPTVPVATNRHTPLTVTLDLQNNTDKPITGVSITAERGSPIGNQTALDAELARTTSAGADGRPITPSRPVTTNLPAAGGAVQVQFRTTTSLLDDYGLCLCANAVYPLNFKAAVTGSDGSATVLASATSYLPSFDQKPSPVKVAWIWPLIDRPHRLGSNTTFTDDALADSIDGGRLSRALAVVEKVTSSTNSRQVPITLMVDPELLDELEVMATRRYLYQTAGGRTVRGKGRDVAQQWLERFDIVEHQPGVQVALTPYADPDVQSLTSAGLGWASLLPAVMSKRVAVALDGVQPLTNLAWPSATRLDRATLTTLQAAGTNTVILGAKAVTSTADDGALPASVAKLSTTGGPVSAALTTSALRGYVRSAVSTGGRGTAALPDLMSELAIQVTQEPTTAHLNVLTPPRYVDPSVDVAVRTILDSSSSPFTTPVALQSAVRSATPTGTSRLGQLLSSPIGLPSSITAYAKGVTDGLPVATAMLSDSRAAAPLLSGLPLGVQRIESSAWRPDSTEGGTSVGVVRARALGAQIRSIRNGVRIVPPRSNSYTLASSNSPLLITIANDLNYPVDIDVLVEAVNGLPGFTAGRLVDRQVAARTKMTFKVPTKVERSGRIRVQAQLRTTTDEPVGPVVPLSVQSTVLGLIGVIITIGAGVVLVLALLIRFVRRVQRRRAKGLPAFGREPRGVAVRTDPAT